MTITIYDTPPSNNLYMGNSRNFNDYRWKKQEWHWMIKTALRMVEKPKMPYQKALVEITYYFKKRGRRDPDNFSGKMLLDPLVREGVLQDDSFDNVELRLKGSYDKDNPRTEIKITEIKE